MDSYQHGYERDMKREVGLFFFVLTADCTLFRRDLAGIKMLSGGRGSAGSNMGIASECGDG